MFRTAEMIYIEQGNIEHALQIYKDLRKWDDAIKLADRRGYSDIEALLKEQMSFLMENNQEEKAGQVLESRGDTGQAMTLYLKANRPTKAARLLLKLPHLLHDEELLNRVIASLIKSGMCVQLKFMCTYFVHTFKLINYTLFAIWRSLSLR